MTLTLSPETEAQLADVAALRGVPPEDALMELIAEARAASEREQQEALAGVRRSEADFAAGRSLSREELRAHTDATIAAKRREARQRGTPA